VKAGDAKPRVYRLTQARIVGLPDEGNCSISPVLAPSGQGFSLLRNDIYYHARERGGGSRSPKHPAVQIFVIL